MADYVKYFLQGRHKVLNDSMACIWSPMLSCSFKFA